VLKIYKNFNLSKIHKKSILLIGNFDGLHLGHQKLFKLAEKYSKKHKVKFGVLTFDPLPVMFFNKKLTNYRITSNLQKNLLFEKAGVDFVIVSRFNKSFSKISADNFIKKIIVKKINPNFIFVSNNFKYGFRRSGNVAKLISKENIYNYKIIKPSPLKKGKKIISSTLIRKLLQRGELKNANKLLGRNWSIIGVVQKGRRIGKKLGVPTCNIDIKNYVIAKPGVYSVRVKVNNSNKIFKGIANLGYRPTFGEKKILLEVNLFNFSGNLYNKSLNVSFYNFIRSEKKFNDHQDLIKQIEKDLKQAKFDLKKNNE
jgi:riboflavin kinase/FMN adenylyltransferase|tara:strand:- start:2797 stop:3735 length:939 start_codon:yes stop_codon:yes gene_type:complete